MANEPSYHNIDEIMEMINNNKIQEETNLLINESNSLKENIDETTSSLQTKAYDLYSHNEELKILQRTFNLKQRDKNVLEQDIKKLKQQYNLWANNLTALAIVASKIFEDTQRMKDKYESDKENLDSQSLTMAFDMLVDKVVGEIIKIGQTK